MIKSYSKDERLVKIYDALKEMASELMEDDIGRKFLSNTADFTGIPGVGNPRKNMGHPQSGKNSGPKSNNQQNQKLRKGPNQAHQQSNYNDKSFASSSRRHNGSQSYYQDNQRPDYHDRQGKRPRGGAQHAPYHAAGPRTHQDAGCPQRFHQWYPENNYGGHQGYYHGAPIYGAYSQYPMHAPHAQGHHQAGYGGYDAMQARPGPYPGYEMNLNVNVHLNYDGTPAYSQRMGPNTGIHITQNQQTQTLQQQKAGASNVIVRSGSHSPYGPKFNAGSTIIERNEFQSQTQETLNGQSFFLMQQQHHAHIGVSHSQNPSGNTSPTLPISGSHLHPKSQGNSATKPPKSASKQQQGQPQVASYQNLSDNFEK